MREVTLPDGNDDTNDDDDDEEETIASARVMRAGARARIVACTAAICYSTRDPCLPNSSPWVLRVRRCTCLSLPLSLSLPRPIGRNAQFHQLSAADEDASSALYRRPPFVAQPPLPRHPLSSRGGARAPSSSFPASLTGNGSRGERAGRSQQSVPRNWVTRERSRGIGVPAPDIVGVSPPYLTSHPPPPPPRLDYEVDVLDGYPGGFWNFCILHVDTSSLVVGALGGTSGFSPRLSEITELSFNPSKSLR